MRAWTSRRRRSTVGVRGRVRAGLADRELDLLVLLADLVLGGRGQGLDVVVPDAVVGVARADHAEHVPAVRHVAGVGVEDAEQIPTQVVVRRALKRSLRQWRARGMVRRQRFQRKRTPDRACSGPPSDIDERFTPFAMRASQNPPLDGASPHVEIAAASALVPRRALFGSRTISVHTGQNTHWWCPSASYTQLIVWVRIDACGTTTALNNLHPKAVQHDTALTGLITCVVVARETRSNTSLQFIKRRVQIPNLVSSSLERGNCARYCIDVNTQRVSAQPLRFDDRCATADKRVTHCEATEVNALFIPLPKTLFSRCM